MVCEPKDRTNLAQQWQAETKANQTDHHRAQEAYDLSKHEPNSQADHMRHHKEPYKSHPEHTKASVAHHQKGTGHRR